MIPAKFSRQSFERAGIAGIDPLLGELQQIIQQATLKVADSSQPAGEKPAELNKVWAQIVDELNEMGHELCSHNYDGHVDFEHHADYWGQNYMQTVQNGLQIAFRTRDVELSWYICRKAPVGQSE